MRRDVERSGLGYLATSVETGEAASQCPRQRAQTGNLRGMEEHRIVGVDAKADQTMLNPHHCAVTA